MFRAKSVVLAGLAILLYAGTANAVYVGGNSYQSFASDSAFAGLTFSNYFYLENFEDGLLNSPGVSANTGSVTSTGFSGAIIDSVDEDDGAVDDKCNKGAATFVNCDSYFASPGKPGVTFTFNQGVLGVLPTHVGIVWTDGLDPILLEAFDSTSTSLGQFGPFNNAGGAHDDQDVLEDTFLGVIDLGGISAIKITSGSGSGGIEVDHLQYGAGAESPVPEPATLLLLGFGIAGLGFARKRLR